MRTEISIRFHCADCGNSLEGDPDGSAFQCSSAQEMDTIISIKPCGVCKLKMTKPVSLLKEALDAIDENRDLHNE